MQGNHTAYAINLANLKKFHLNVFKSILIAYLLYTRKHSSQHAARFVVSLNNNTKATNYTS